MIPVGEDRPTPMSTTEAGRKGGSAVRDKYGEDYYRRIGKKGGSVLKEKRGTEYYRAIAKKGGNASMAKNGIDHFSEMGKKGGKTTKERLGADFYSRIGKMGGAAYTIVSRHACVDSPQMLARERTRRTGDFCEAALRRTRTPRHPEAVGRGQEHRQRRIGQ